MNFFQKAEQIVNLITASHLWMRIVLHSRCWECLRNICSVCVSHSSGMNAIILWVTWVPVACKTWVISWRGRGLNWWKPLRHRMNQSKCSTKCSCSEFCYRIFGINVCLHPCAHVYSEVLVRLFLGIFHEWCLLSRKVTYKGMPEKLLFCHSALKLTFPLVENYSLKFLH